MIKKACEENGIEYNANKLQRANPDIVKIRYVEHVYYIIINQEDNYKYWYPTIKCFYTEYNPYVEIDIDEDAQKYMEESDALKEKCINFAVENCPNGYADYLQEEFDFIFRKNRKSKKRLASSDDDSDSDNYHVKRIDKLEDLLYQ